MKNKTLSVVEITNIIDRYTNTSDGIETLSAAFGVGKLKIKKVLLDHDIPIKGKGGQITIGGSSDIERSRSVVYTPKDDSTVLIAVCKRTNKRFNDVNNISGILTSHILETYGNVPIPNNTYQRKRYERENGRKWFEDYFDLIEVDKPKVKKCPYCDWETTDLHNKSGQFQHHLIKAHKISIEEHLKSFKDDLKYFNKYNDNMARNVDLSDMTKHTICMICGDRLKVISNSHLKKHNITPMEYKTRFSKSKLMSTEMHNKFSEQFRLANIDMKPRWSSKGELELLDYIKSLGIVVEKCRNRSLLSGKEIDLVIPKLKIGIEYNGLYYHTERMGKRFNYHINKTIACNDIGYGLIHIFEDEWVLSNTLVKNKLKHILGISGGIRIGARKCELKEITSNHKSKFLNRFHIQGNDKSNISIGAFNNGELVGVMTFASVRGMTKNLVSGTYELSRFATNYNYIISGLGSRLLSFFIKKYSPNKIISFADRRWTLNPSDNMYTKLGFNLTNIGKPSYWYYNPKVDRYKRHHKFGFGKSSLKRRYPNLDFSKTESQLMTELGYDRIWDCGLFKYELEVSGSNYR